MIASIANEDGSLVGCNGPVNSHVTLKVVILIRSIKYRLITKLIPNSRLIRESNLISLIK
jgi:hypothetical protein